jgi:hypothetical protein
MNSPSHGTAIAYDDVATALSILRDVLAWSLSLSRWTEVDRSMTALAATLEAADGGALRHEMAVLEFLGPVRGPAALIEDARVATPVPDPVRERILKVIRTLEGFIPVAIFLSDSAGHEHVEGAVEQLLRSAGLYVVSRAAPVEGSWFRSMLAASRSPSARDALGTTLHAADSRFVQQQDAQNTAMLMQNMGPLIAALQPTKDAVIRVGAFLVVKIDWVVVVHQLTANQQLRLDHSPELAAVPRQILRTLGLHAAEPGQAIPGGPAA